MPQKNKVEKYLKYLSTTVDFVTYVYYTLIVLKLKVFQQKRFTKYDTFFKKSGKNATKLQKSE